MEQIYETTQGLGKLSMD